MICLNCITNKCWLESVKGALILLEVKIQLVLGHQIERLVQLKEIRNISDFSSFTHQVPVFISIEAMFVLFITEVKCWRCTFFRAVFFNSMIIISNVIYVESKVVFFFLLQYFIRAIVFGDRLVLSITIVILFIEQQIMLVIFVLLHWSTRRYSWTIWLLIAHLLQFQYFQLLLFS